MQWVTHSHQEVRLKDLVKSSKSVEQIVLATDPDREGEAISWHILEELKDRGAGDDLLKRASRVTFTEVTKSAVLEALKFPRKINDDLVEAYFARRALDRLFGFGLSEVLWRKLTCCKSAGRVQSAALRMLCEREADIDKFRPELYYTIAADVVLSDGSTLSTHLHRVDGKAPPKPGFPDKRAAQDIVERITNTETFTVSMMEKKDVKRSPSPPFTTSTMTQEASRKLNMSASNTMRAAQALYEAGYITYHRTDSISLSSTATDSMREAIHGEYGENYVPQQRRSYKSKAKNAQEAHEAIRPTMPHLNSFAIKAKLASIPRGADVYELIRNRALASQMVDATVEQVRVDLSDSNNDKSDNDSKKSGIVLRATATRVKFPGFMSAYTSPPPSSSKIEQKEGDNESEDEDGLADITKRSSSKKDSNKAAAMGALSRALAKLHQGEEVSIKSATSDEHSTKPPPRYTEGSLIKAMEEAGIGRPSTYASIMKVLQERQYASKDKQALKAEPRGRILSVFLQKYFPDAVDYQFTSKLEERLDDVASGEVGWKDVLSHWWQPFSGLVDGVKEVTVTDVIDTLNELLAAEIFPATEEVKVESGALGSTNAATSSTSNTTSNDPEEEESRQIDNHSINTACPHCQSPLSLKISAKTGPFVACSNYPTCTYTRQPFLQNLVQRDPSSSSSLLSVLDDSYKVAKSKGLKDGSRYLGIDPGTGQEVFALQGPYGAYCQLGVPVPIEVVVPDIDEESDEGSKRPTKKKKGTKAKKSAGPKMTQVKRTSLKKGMSITTVTLGQALKLLELPKLLGAHPETGDEVMIKRGRFGVYVTCGGVSRSVTAKMDPSDVTLENALDMLEEKLAKAALAEEGGGGDNKGDNDSEGDGKVQRRYGRGSGSYNKKSNGPTMTQAWQAYLKSYQPDGDLVKRGQNKVSQASASWQALSPRERRDYLDRVRVAMKDKEEEKNEEKVEEEESEGSSRSLVKKNKIVATTTTSSSSPTSTKEKKQKSTKKESSTTSSSSFSSDEGKPKRAKSAWLIYLEENRSGMKALLEQSKNEGEKVSPTEVVSELGEQWRNLSDGDKQVYLDKAEEEKRKWKQLKVEWEEGRREMADV